MIKIKNNDKMNDNKLQEQIAICCLCQDTFGFKPHPIVSGNPNAKIMQIGQAPSLSVHNTGKPFNDASGRRLRKEWYHIEDEVFYNPDNFYITSIAHCYPGKAVGGGDRRPPKLCAETWLQKELDYVQNEIYLLIGGYAADYFFPGQKITTLAFEDREINGKPAFILPHPSPLNMKWFKDYPEFLEKRVFEIEKQIHRVLGIPSGSI
jgi:uracil-DNA glycosylase family 4